MELQEIMVLNNKKDHFKFLYITDTHFNATSPKNRKDNLLDTSLLKMAEVRDISEKNEVDFVLHGGDFFEKADVTDLVAGRVASELKKFKMPIYVVPGGHDLYGNNIETVQRTKLGLLSQTGLLNLLIHPNKDCVIIKNDQLSVQLTGTASHYGIDHQGIEDDYILKYKNADFAIHMIHGMLMPKPFLPNTPTIMIDSIKDTLADVTLSGHYHNGFEPVFIDGKWYINCGALVRKKNDLKEIARMPQVALITVSKAKGIEVEFIQLTTAKPGEDVLDRTEIEKKQLKAVQRQSFLGQMQNAKTVQSMNVNTIVQDMAQNKQLPEEVVKEAMDRISKMQELLESGKPIHMIGKNEELKYISKIIIQNFQSHEYTVVDLTNGINVLVGESDKGKSAIVRALKWVLYNEPKGTDFIRRGQTECTVTVIMSDGYEITRTRKKTKNSYIVKDPNGNETKFENFRDDIPAEVIEATGVMKIQVDSDKELALNINEQLESPFLLSESGTVKAKTVGSIVKTNVLDAAERDVQKDIQSINTQIKELDNQIKDTDAKLEDYDGIDKAEAALKRMEQLIEQLVSANATLEKLQYLYSKISSADAELVKNKEVISQLSTIPHLEVMYQQLSAIFKAQKQVTNLKNKIEIKTDDIGVTAEILSKLKGLGNYEEMVKRLDAVHSSEKKLTVKKTAIDSIEQEIGKQGTVITQLKVLPHLETMVTQLKDAYRKNKAAIDRKASIDTMSLEIGKQEAVLKKLEVLPVLEQRCKRLQEIQSKNKTAAEKKVAIEAVGQEILKQSTLLERLKTLPEFEAKYTRLVILKAGVEKTVPLQVKCSEVEKSMITGRDYLAKTKQSLETAVDVYVENLKTMGKCPTCTHKITDKEIQKIANELKGEM